jgi:EmrB/QacA subfamily drug resistance transporter
LTRTQRLTLAAAISGSAVAAIDATVVNVALPAISRDLGGGLADQQWISNGYLLALGSLILIGGSLGDIFGERRTFTIGVALFGICSIAVAAAPTIGFLIAARILQGVAAAALTPASLAVIVAAFPERERGPAIGTWLAWGTVGMIVGPLAGGLVVDRLSWRWVFALNVPLVLATLGLVRAGVARTPRMPGRRIDWTGAALCALGLGGLVYALIEQPKNGWGSAETLIPLIGGVLLLAAFVGFERRTSQPMLELSLFAQRNFTAGNIETFSVYGGLGAMFFFLVIFLQQVVGWSALDAGLATLPTTVIMFLLSRRMGALAGRYGPRWFMGAGPIVGACGVLLLLRCGRNLSAATDLVPALAVFSVGLSMTVAPLTATVLADVGEHDAGIASAVNNAIARIASLLAVSCIGIVVSGRLVHGAFAADQGSVDAFHMVMMLCAIVIAAGGVIGAIGIRNPDRPAPTEIGELDE